MRKKLTVDHRGVHHDASQIWVRHCFVQDESSNAAEQNMIISLTGVAVSMWATEGERHNGAEHCLYVNDVHRGLVNIFIHDTNMFQQLHWMRATREGMNMSRNNLCIFSLLYWSLRNVSSPALSVERVSEGVSKTISPPASCSVQLPGSMGPGVCVCVLQFVQEMSHQANQTLGVTDAD